MNLLPRFLLHPILAGSFPQFNAVLMIPVAAMIFALLVIGIGSYFRSKEDQRRHETARLALEKGQPIPGFAESWLRSESCNGGQKSWIGLMVGGMINVAVGIGLYFMLCSIPGAYVARFCAFIPGLIGVALLACALIVALSSRNKSDAGGPPPMS
jgi:hypothetical protein